MLVQVICQVNTFMKMLHHYVAFIAPSWNDNDVRLVYCIAFVGERERGRKQCDFAPLPQKKTQYVLFQNSTFSKMEQVESDTVENLGRSKSDRYQYTNYYKLNITIVKSYFDPKNFENILIENIRKKTLIAEGKQTSFNRMTL